MIFTWKYQFTQKIFFQTLKHFYFLDAQFWHFLTAIFGHVISRFKNQCIFCYQCNLDLNLKCFYQVQLTRKNIYKGYINLWNSVVRREGGLGWSLSSFAAHTTILWCIKKGQTFLLTDCAMTFSSNRLSRLNSVEGKKNDWNSTPNCISQMT